MAGGLLCGLNKWWQQRSYPARYAQVELAASVHEPQTDWDEQTQAWLERWQTRPKQALPLAQLAYAKQTIVFTAQTGIVDWPKLQQAHQLLTGAGSVKQSQQACLAEHMADWYHCHWLYPYGERYVQLQQYQQCLLNHSQIPAKPTTWQRLQVRSESAHTWLRAYQQRPVLSWTSEQRQLQQTCQVWSEALLRANEVQLLWQALQQECRSPLANLRHAEHAREVAQSLLQQLPPVYGLAQQVIADASEKTWFCLLLVNLSSMTNYHGKMSHKHLLDTLSQCEWLVHQLAYYRQRHHWSQQTSELFCALYPAHQLKLLLSSYPAMNNKLIHIRHQLNGLRDEERLRLRNYVEEENRASLPAGRYDEALEYGLGGKAIRRAKLIQCQANNAVPMPAIAAPLGKWYGPACTVGGEKLPRLATTAMTLVWATCQGRRLYQQDKLCSRAWPEHDLSCVAIFDGHGEAGVARHAASHYPELLLAHLQGLSIAAQQDPKQVAQAIKSSFATKRGQITDHFAAAVPDLSTSVAQFAGQQVSRLRGGGSTALVAVWLYNMCYIANLGDSRAVLIGASGETRSLTVDHTLANPWEMSRIVRHGGSIINNRLSGVLMPTRALGNETLQRRHNWPPGVLKARPQITVVAMGTYGQSTLLLASDGLFEALDEKTCGQFVAQQLAANCPLQTIAADLLKASYLRGSEDNISIALIQPNQDGLAVIEGRETEEEADMRRGLALT